MEKHLTAVAALHVGLSILGGLIGIFIFVLLTGIGAITQQDTIRLFRLHP